ncbi:hypothetical protein BpHYR1_014291 [Brachionus plicatilis]|uniref:Uncharacterized protein n=1 Tax=Brachionus plicatilis TaxID=10195 RepID=A0A3M7R5Y5_BRAPC|nr:hypothetical protein BpHYR1_014291 [Brachionus plicatilis]
MTQSCPNISLTQFKKPIRDCNKENNLKLIRLRIYKDFLVYGMLLCEAEIIFSLVYCEGTFSDIHYLRI